MIFLSLSFSKPEDFVSIFMYSCFDFTEIIFTVSLSSPVSEIYFEMGSLLFEILPKFNVLGFNARITCTSALILSLTSLCAGSFVCTEIPFFAIPFFEPTLKDTSIFPSPPGGISLAEARAAVQPQPALTFSIIKTSEPVFLNLNVCLATWF